MATELRALATDYDGTLATEGRVNRRVLDHLSRLRSHGIALILVTGRRRDELATVFPDYGIFHAVVAENGGVLLMPGEKREEVLAPPPPHHLIAELQRRVPFLDTGRVVIATRRPYDRIVDAVIRQFGLTLAVVYNREAAMFLPPGIDKSSGLAAALRILGIGWDETVGIGDADNDEQFLRRCGRSVAVGNALPWLKELVDVVTVGENGSGVIEAATLLFGTMDGPSSP